MLKSSVKKCLLLCDSWSSNKNNELFTRVATKFADQLDVEKLIIPTGTTGMIQPLDVFFFRPYKRFVKQITDTLEVEEKIWQREQCIKFHSLAIFTFQATRFTNMIKYAFWKCGYIQERPEKFGKSPVNSALTLTVSAIAPKMTAPSVRVPRCALREVLLFQALPAGEHSKNFELAAALIEIYGGSRSVQGQMLRFVRYIFAANLTLGGVTIGLPS